MRTITCLCDKSFDADIPEAVDLDTDSTLLGRIVDGNFNAYVCPSCGTRLKPEFSVRLSGKALARDLYVIPEIERLSLYASHLDLPAGCEVLVGYPELMERMRIVRDGLDAEACEILKFYLLGRAEEANPDAEIAILYMGREAGKLVYHLYGAREGETGVLKVPEETYAGILKDKKRKMAEAPFAEVFSGPYRSVRSLEGKDDEEDQE